MGNGVARVPALKATKPVDFPSFRAAGYVRPQVESTRVYTCRVPNDSYLCEAREIGWRSRRRYPIGYNCNVGRTG